VLGQEALDLILRDAPSGSAAQIEAVELIGAKPGAYGLMADAKSQRDVGHGEQVVTRHLHSLQRSGTR
jgi:hypothetical protein